MTSFMTATGFGIITAGIIVMAAVGFTLQFSVTGILNIAFGSQMTMAAFIAFLVNSTFGLNVWAALVIAGLFGGVTSIFLNRALISPFLKRGTTFFGIFIVTIAIDLILEYLIEAIWGPTFVHYQIASGNPVKIGPMLVTPVQLIILAIGIVAMAAVHAVLRYTKLGKAMRAAAANPGLARSSGVPTARITDIAWFISGMLGGIAGVTLALSFGSLSFTLGDSYLIILIAAAVLGGVGNAYGAMLGSLIIGLITQWSSLVIPSAYSDVAAFVMLVVVLLIRPAGILAGQAKLRGVAA
jgi:branched-chain amino acid transport system permease protein/neutral amino acid transport system permease protein